MKAQVFVKTPALFLSMKRIQLIAAILVILFSIGVIYLHSQPKISTIGAASPTAHPVISTPAPTPIDYPNTLTIDKIKVSASIEQVGLDKDKKMDVPKLSEDVGWYNLGPFPGQKGNVVIDGHLDSQVGPAVFWHLAELTTGDQIKVQTKSGTTYTYIVQKKQSYPYDQFPLQQVFGPSDQYNLNLITCAGTFDRSAKNYSNRIVIYSTLAR